MCVLRFCLFGVLASVVSVGCSDGDDTAPRPDVLDQDTAVSDTSGSVDASDTGTNEEVGQDADVEEDTETVEDTGTVDVEDGTDVPDATDDIADAADDVADATDDIADATDDVEADVEAPPLYTGAITDPDNSANITEFATEIREIPEEGNSDALFDGNIDQSTAEVAWSREWYDEWTARIGREWRCSVRLDRVELYPPTDAGFFEHGETGSVELIGYVPEGNGGGAERASEMEYDRDYTLAIKYVRDSSSTEPLVFDASDLPLASYYAHAVRLRADEPAGSAEPPEARIDEEEGDWDTTVRIAEVVFRGECVGEESVIEWDVSEWTCPVTCEEASNEGVQSRSVVCRRDDNWEAHPDLCEGEEPAEAGEACVLECPYVLEHVGYGPYTTANDSGWLHRGTAGPLPSSTAYATAVEDIEGKPCSVLTVNPLSWLFAPSCRNPDTSQHCAFQCLEPDAE